MKKLVLLILLSSDAFGSYSYQHRRSLSADAIRYFGMTEDNSAEDRAQVIYQRMEAKFELLGDCGNLDMRASFKSIYSSFNQLFSDLKSAAIGSAQSVGRAAPMLALCYFSPTACSIAKNLKLYASYATKLKFDQCQAINRYIDQRASVYREEQSNCVRQAMNRTGDVQKSVDQCKNFADKMTSWVNGSTQTRGSSNQLIRDSAKWAGIKDENDIGLMQALLGGVEYYHSGRTSANFGGRKPLTPNKLLRTYTHAAYKKLCGRRGVLIQWEAHRTGDRQLADTEYFSSRGQPLINQQLMDSLARLPQGEQEAACNRLATSLSLTKFIDTMEDKFDKIHVMLQNPHLPESERHRLESKADRLAQETISVVRLTNLRRETLNTVRANILDRATNISQEEANRAVVNSNATKPRNLPAERCDDFLTCRLGGR